MGTETLTYESVWLENDQVLKVKEFLEKLGVTKYIVQRIEEEGVSLITVPEISLENWNKVEDFEYSLLRGDWEEEKDPTVLQQLQNNLANSLFSMTAAEAKEKGICLSCKSPIRYEVGADTSGESGQIYSDAGMREYQKTALCETCFDSLFDESITGGEREIEELESFVENKQ